MILCVDGHIYCNDALPFGYVEHILHDSHNNGDFVCTDMVCYTLVYAFYNIYDRYCIYACSHVLFLKHDYVFDVYKHDV